jgi:NADH-quinone oxidoreductase subunit J
MTTTGEEVTFWILGTLAVVGALGLLFARKAVHAALGMALAMLSLGIFYIQHGAAFLGVVQIFVYSGAVMMLFLFVVMLVGVDSSDSLVETIKGQKWATLVLSLGLAGLLFAAIGHITITGKPTLDAANASGTADHRRLGGYGAGTPRARRPPAHPAGAVPGARAQQRVRRGQARPGCLRTA